MATAHLLDHDVHGPRDAPVVVLGSSLGVSRSMWDEQLPALSREFRVIRYDHRGHGTSPAPPGPYTVAFLGADVLELLDHLGVERAHHVGLSLGGMVAMWLAARAPDRVDRLVLACTAAYLPPAQGWLDRAAAVRAHGTGSVADAVARRWFTPAFAASERATALRGGLARIPANGYARCCEAIAALDLRPDLPAIRADTLVIAGDQDEAIPPALAAEIVAGLAGRARLELVPAAHLASVEQADRVTALILAHLTASPSPLAVAPWTGAARASSTERMG